MKEKMRVAVVVLAAGSGARFGHSTNKVWLPLKGRTIISRSVKNAVASFNDPRTVLVINPLDRDLAEKVLDAEIPEIDVEIVEGGAARHDSEYNALMYLSEEIDSGEINVVLIHDGARPLASEDLFDAVARTAFEHGGALPGIEVDPREIDVRSDKKIMRVQTPQAFRAKEVLDSYIQAKKDGFIGTDTAACVEKYYPHIESVLVAGEVKNLKITYSPDLALAEALL